MKTIGVYGSLKKGCYNFERFNMGEDRHIGNSTIRGAMDLMARSYPRLYPIGTYPEHESDHVLEIYEISDEKFARLDMMERGAGYQQHVIACGELGDAIVWLMNPDYPLDLECFIEKYPV